MIGIIGGSGLEKISDQASQIDIKTPYGIVPVQVLSLENTEIVFLSRHGLNHTIPPHKINYKANIWALKMMNVSNIIATAAVGSLRSDLAPGMFGIVSQFIDFTKNRESTFFDHFSDAIQHTDMTFPYSESINTILDSILTHEKLPFQGNLTLVVTEGPRFETSAEIRAYSLLGAEIVGMTGYPEVALARELSMEYSTLAVCTNFAAGIKKQKLSHQEVLETMEQSFDTVKLILKKAIHVLKDLN